MALIYNMQRSYVPGIGRYAQSDPIGLNGGINSYAYAKDAPTILSAKYGLQTFDAEISRCRNG